MFPKAVQTAGPNKLKFFFKEPMDTLGVTQAEKILNLVFFKCLIYYKKNIEACCGKETFTEDLKQLFCNSLFIQIDKPFSIKVCF